MKLPNAENAVVDIAKLRDYSLNAAHDKGADKARVFAAALGFTQTDAERLRSLVLNAARIYDAREGKLLSYGQMYVLDFPVQSARGEVIIRTAWIVEQDTDFPRLVTCYVK